MNRILIISPTPSHPQDAGNRARIFQISELLKGGLKAEVFFLYIPFEVCDLEQMKKYWGDNFFLFNGSLETKFSFLEKLLKKIKIFINKKRYSHEENIYNCYIDDFYPHELTKFVTEIQKIYNFTHIIVEYVYLSKLFNSLNNVIKILDTHDLLSNRFKIFLENKEAPQWYSFFSSEEKLGFKRSDYIVSIQENDEHIIKDMVSNTKKVLNLGYSVDTESKKNRKVADKIVFVASGNYINIKCVNYFINNILKNINLKYPNVKLLIAGSICDSKNRIIKSENVIFLGRFQNPSEVYSIADIAINPVNIGTGLKIKSIEALSYGMPLVTYSHGIEGLPNFFNKNFCEIVQNDIDFIDKIIFLIESYKRREYLSINALDFIKKYNDNETKNFLNIFK